VTCTSCTVQLASWWSCVMPNGQARKCTKSVKQLATIDQLLAAGMKQGPAKKKDAIKKILHLVPGWTREQCWRRIQHLRRVTSYS